MTKNSEKILQLINESTCHPTAEQIYEMLQKQNENVVLATVYNNLATLTKNGMIRKLKVDDGPDHYDKVIPHDHLVCSKCGKIEDFTLGDLTHNIEAALGKQIESYDLHVSYVCDDCRNSVSE